MNRTLTLLDIAPSPSLQPIQLFIALKSPGCTNAAESRCISGDLTDFSSTNGALRAVKWTEEINESKVCLTRYCAKPTFTTNTVHQRIELTWKHPRR